MSKASAKVITLKSSDDQIFVIEEAVALQSKTLEQMIADNDNENIVIPLTTVTGSILAKVIDYCNKHAEAETSDEEKKIWDTEFVNFDVLTNTRLIFGMVLAANELNIQGLLDLASEKVAKAIYGKTPEEIRRLFNVPNFRPVEEEEALRENRNDFF